MEIGIYQMNGGWSVKFTIGTQHFNLAPTDKESAKFLKKMLKKAIATNYEDVIYKQSEAIRHLQLLVNSADEMFSSGSAKV
jgi:hypothetical protein